MRGGGNHGAPLIYSGDYSATRMYLPREVVKDGGQVYMALAKGSGHAPALSPTYWLHLGGERFVDLWHRDRWELTADGAQVLSFTWEPKATPLFVFLNGIYQEEGTDFDVTGSGLYVHTAMDALTDDVLEARYLIGGVGTTVNPMSVAVLTDLPALYWTLGDAPGSTVVLDSSGNGRHGYPAGPGGITFGTGSLIPGVPETSAFWDWNRLTRDSEPWMDFGEFALEVLIRTTDAGGGMVWTRYDTGTGQNAFILKIYEGTGGKLIFVRGPSGTLILTSVASVTDGEPHHVVVNYDGTTLELWIDGVLDSSAPMSPLPGAVTPLWLGGYYATGWGTDGWNDYAGYMQHAAVYTHALAPDRIAAHAAAAGF